MALIAVMLLFTLAVAGLVVLYVAFPHRGLDIPKSVPQAERLNTHMRRLAELLSDRLDGTLDQRHRSEG